MLWVIWGLFHAIPGLVSMAAAVGDDITSIDLLDTNNNGTILGTVMTGVSGVAIALSIHLAVPRWMARSSPQAGSPGST